MEKMEFPNSLNDLDKLRTQLSLFGEKVSVKKNGKRNGNGRKHPGPFDGICCESCWNAKEEECIRRCGGVNHGRGLTGKFSKLDAFEKKTRTAFVPGEPTSWGVL